MKWRSSKASTHPRAALSKIEQIGNPLSGCILPPALRGSSRNHSDRARPVADETPTGNFTLALGAAHAAPPAAKIKKQSYGPTRLGTVYREGGLLFCAPQGAP